MSLETGIWASRLGFGGGWRRRRRRAKIRPETAELRLWWPGWGTDGRTDVSKFPPVSYRTSALWGRCPKRAKILNNNDLIDKNADFC